MNTIAPLTHPARCITTYKHTRQNVLASAIASLMACSAVHAEQPSNDITSADTVTVLPTVIVNEKALDTARAHIAPSLGATRYTLDSNQIDSQSQGENAPFDQTFYRFPGVAQDELDKRLHVRGEEADLQYRINDMLIPDGLSGFGQELSPRFLDTLSLITGTLPAQYGNRTAAIVDMKTKNAQDMHGGTLSYYGGSYNTTQVSAEYASNRGALSGYGTLSYLQDSLGMANPDSSFSANHDNTHQLKGFGTFSYLIDSNSRLSLIVSNDNGSFQIPTIPGQTPIYQYNSITTTDSSKINENQYEQAYYEILGYQKKTDKINWQITQSHRYSNVRFTPDTIADVLFNGVASKASHQLLSNTIDSDLSDHLNDQHTVRSGMSVSLQHAQVDTTDTVLPATWNASSDQWQATTNTQPLTIVDNYNKNARLYGAYMQDEWHIQPEVIINYGLRADLWQAYTTESQISPRINVVDQITHTTTLHAGYGKYFTPPPLELIQGGDLSKFTNTTNGVAPSLLENQIVKSERYRYYDAGINQDITPTLHTSVDVYYKHKTNVLDEGQFGPAMIFSPNNAQKGFVRGIELTISYENSGFTAWGNIARSRAMAYGLSSGQWQFSSDELTYMQSHWYHLDHDQDWTASTGIAYQLELNKIYADLLYGSGLYGGFCNESELPNYATANIGATHDFKMANGSNFKLRVDVTNVTDVKYEIRDGSGIGVFAPQYLPRRAFYIGLSKSFN